MIKSLCILLTWFTFLLSSDLTNLLSIKSNNSNRTKLIFEFKKQRDPININEVEPIEESIEEPEEMQCHPVGWTKQNHYSELGWQWCGQSCPCCRAHAGDTIGACPVCIRERE